MIDCELQALVSSYRAAPVRIVSVRCRCGEVLLPSEYERGACAFCSSKPAAGGRAL